MNINDFMKAKEYVDEYRRLETLVHQSNEMVKWGYIRVGDVRIDGELQGIICATLQDYYKHEVTRVTNELYKLGVEL